MDFEKLDDLCRAEGWGKITDEALRIRPSNVESQARDVARWADARITALEVQLAERTPGPDAETYYSKGKDADWFEKLDNKAFAWELTCAAQDLNDTGLDEPASSWMPVLAMLSGAADRIAALEAENERLKRVNNGLHDEVQFMRQAVKEAGKP